ncbi:hypothetical protein FS837_001420 [Tulasnella sp. UAMH 9824]|nr:hypothetical protein FS837_001420 [Tulasnella sp. UAMH 9824]
MDPFAAVPNSNEPAPPPYISQVEYDEKVADALQRSLVLEDTEFKATVVDELTELPTDRKAVTPTRRAASIPARDCEYRGLKTVRTRPSGKFIISSSSKFHIK